MIEHLGDAVIGICKKLCPEMTDITNIVIHCEFAYYVQFGHSRGMNSRATPLKFVCRRISHYTCLLTGIFSDSQLHFLANRNAELAGGSQ